MMVNVEQCRDQITALLDRIPGMFSQTPSTDNAAFAALKAAYYLLVRALFDGPYSCCGFLTVVRRTAAVAMLCPLCPNWRMSGRAS